MKITYTVTRRARGKRSSQTGSLDLPQYTPADWPKDSLHREIKKLIKAKHPRWTLSGYAIDHKRAKQAILGHLPVKT